jgi:hypothetical protein
MKSTSTTKKPNSPASPSFGLKEVLADAGKLYQKYSHASFSQAEVASGLGMSSTSSSFSRRLRSLTEFGLLDTTGGNYRISKLFHNLADAQNGTSVFKTSAFSAIQRSTVFADILSDFKTKLPEQAVVAQRLEKQRGFNADRAKEVAAVLQKSLEFAGVVDSNNNILPTRDAPEARFANPQDVLLEQEVEREPPSARSPRRSEIPLSDGRVAVVVYPHDLTTAEAQKIGSVLTALVA